MFEASYDDTMEWVQVKSDHLVSQLPPLEDATGLQQQIEEQKVCIVQCVSHGEAFSPEGILC